MLRAVVYIRKKLSMVDNEERGISPLSLSFFNYEIKRI